MPKREDLCHHSSMAGMLRGSGMIKTGSDSGRPISQFPGQYFTGDGQRRTGTAITGSWVGSTMSSMFPVTGSEHGGGSALVSHRTVAEAAVLVSSRGEGQGSMLCHSEGWLKAARSRGRSFGPREKVIARSQHRTSSNLLMLSQTRWKDHGEDLEEDRRRQIEELGILHPYRSNVVIQLLERLYHARIRTRDFL